MPTDLEGFRRYLATSSKLGARTQLAYVAEVRRILDLYPLATLTPEQLLRWHTRLVERRLASSTINVRHAALDKFLRYLRRFGRPGQIAQATRLLGALDDLEVGRGPPPKRPPFVVDEATATAVMEAAGAHPTTGIRDYALLLFMWDTACREAEVASLRLGDVQLHERMARVVGKGLKERTVPFSARCRAALHAWREVRHAWPQHSAAFFLSARGGPLSTSQIRAILQRACRTAGLKRNIWPHIFRHSQATLLAEEGMPVATLAKQLGHANIQTTMRYYHPAPEHLRDEYDKVKRAARKAAAEREEDDE